MGLCKLRFGLPLFKHTALGFKLRSRTWVSKLLMTSTAMFRTPSFVWGLSLLLGFSIIHTRPSSFKASLMSLILILSLALFEYLLSLLFSGSSSSDASLMAFFALFPPFPVLEEVTLTELGDVGSVEYGEFGKDVISPGCVE